MALACKEGLIAVLLISMVKLGEEENGNFAISVFEIAFKEVV